MSENWHETSNRIVQDFFAWCRVEAEIVGAEASGRVLSGTVMTALVTKLVDGKLLSNSFTFDLEQLRHAKFPMLFLTLRFRGALDSVLKGKPTGVDSSQ